MKSLVRVDYAHAEGHWHGTGVKSKAFSKQPASVGVVKDDVSFVQTSLLGHQYCLASGSAGSAGGAETAEWLRKSTSHTLWRGNKVKMGVVRNFIR